jgi:hypothetical protein
MNDVFDVATFIVIYNASEVDLTEQYQFDKDDVILTYWNGV